MGKLKCVSLLLLMFAFGSANAGVYKSPDKAVEKVLDLRIVDMGYRWVQDLNDNNNGNAMRTFMTFGFTKQDTFRFGWNREGISDPFQNGNDNVMFEFKHKFQ
jgi:hypothetical protein